MYADDSPSRLYVTRKNSHRFDVRDPARAKSFLTDTLIPAEDCVAEALE